MPLRTPTKSGLYLAKIYLLDGSGGFLCIGCWILVVGCFGGNKGLCEEDVTGDEIWAELKVWEGY